MFTRRSFLSRAFLATAAFLGCGFALPAQQTNHRVLARWDGLLTQSPVYIDWWDMVPGDIVRFGDGGVMQVSGLPYYYTGLDIPCADVSGTPMDFGDLIRPNSFNIPCVDGLMRTCGNDIS